MPITLTPEASAAILLLRNLANRIECGEVGISSLSNAVLIDELRSSDPYSHILPVRKKLEVITFMVSQSSK